MSPVRVRYQTIEVGDFDIHVRSLRDTNEFCDDSQVAAQLGIHDAQWSTFGVLWDAGLALAHLMATHEAVGMRILEVGCGLGLSSLVLSQRHLDITATDRHPSAGAFLERNAALNGHDPVPFERVDWTDTADGLGLFDLIIGSDLLYERDHPKLLSAFIDRHANDSCEVILSDPGRKRMGKFGKHMLALGFSYSRERSDARDPNAPDDSNLLRLVRVDGVAG